MPGRTAQNVELVKPLDLNLLWKAFELMQISKHLTETYEQNREICDKYVHSTARGHEAIQLAAGLQLKEYDYAAPYYRDEAMLLGMGLEPY
ncbi:MAG TPA: hypothetical protein PLJ13_15385, partial [Cyclobacteriaceae bacterium]|nr:hypothetical protein [Cyclobacteriaceae bacterium]